MPCSWSEQTGEQQRADLRVSPQPSHGFRAIFFRSAFPTIWEPGFLERAAQLAIRVAALQWLLALYNRRYLTEREERGTTEPLFPLSPTLY